MKAWKWMSGVAVALAVLNTAWLYAQQRKLPSMLSPEDYLEIQQLYSYYARDVDSGTMRDASWMYTEDGVWNVENQKFVGTEALKKFYMSTPPGMTRNGVRHFSTNLVLVPTAEGARGSAYMMALERRSQDTAVTITTGASTKIGSSRRPGAGGSRSVSIAPTPGTTSPTKVLPSPFAPVE